MLIYGEFGTFGRLFECFGLLINGRFIAMEITLNIMLLWVCNRNLGEMKRRSLVVFAGDPLEDSGSALLDLCLWELCFSLVSHLWESCYSLASC